MDPNQVHRNRIFKSNAMGWNRGKQLKHCRWCTKVYFACQPVDLDGFCTPAHKQAHYRAYKKYVTATSISAATAANLRVTTSKAKKKGKKHVKKT